MNDLHGDSKKLGRGTLSSARLNKEAYHAMNNVFSLEAAMKGRYPKAFVGEPPYKQIADCRPFLP
jgi:hypothetical protein